ncbi:hypothetical protein ACFLQW_01705 [Candidatus Zixiibacteriota bacterium]
MNLQTRFLVTGLMVLAMVALAPVIPCGSDRAVAISECDCGVWGDVDGDAGVTPNDVAYMVNLVYRNRDALVQPPACPNPAGDANCDGTVTPLDLVLYVNLVYRANGLGWCGNPCGPRGSLVDASDCKAGQPGKTAVIYSECIDYEYDGMSVLQLRHFDAQFNCCPDSFTAEISIVGTEILIEESEWVTGGGCDCWCPYDLDYVITGLPPGEYTISLTGSRRPGGGPDPLVFTINLVTTPSNHLCETW